MADVTAVSVVVLAGRGRRAVDDVIAALDDTLATDPAEAIVVAPDEEVADRLHRALRRQARVIAPPEYGGQSLAVRQAIEATIGDEVVIIAGRARTIPRSGRACRDSVRLCRADAMRAGFRLGRGSVSVRALRRLATDMPRTATWSRPQVGTRLDDLATPADHPVRPYQGDITTP